MQLRKRLGHGLWLGLGVLAATPAHADATGPASQDEILTGVRSCIASVDATGLDETKLVADGWSKGSISKDGKPVASPLIIYGKGNLMLLSSKPDPGKVQLCTVMARIPGAAAFLSLRSAMAAAYGHPFQDDGKGEQTFRSPDHRFIDIAATGSNDRPTVRIAVGYMAKDGQ